MYRGRVGLRTLLATLADVWPEAAADARLRVTYDDDAVRKAYLRAVRMVHPDKQGPDVPLRRRVLAQKLAAVLAEAWATFNECGM